MKILLIFPPSTIYGADPASPAIIPPLGLAYLAGYLRKHGYSDVHILDAMFPKDRIIRTENTARYGLTDEELFKAISEYNADIIGISCMYTVHSSDAHNVARIVKEINRNIPVVFGGAHSSTFPKLVLEDKNVDIVAYSEGEETLLDIVRTVEQNGHYRNIKQIYYRMDDVIMQNPNRELIGDLDKIPFPARDLLDMNLYLDDKISQYGMRAPTTTMITSRGCPQNCTYCTIQQVWGTKKWRAHSPKFVVDEMEHLHKEYGIQELGWLDDAAGTRKKRIIEICDEIIRRKLDIRWTTPNGIAHWYLDEKTLDKMKAAGCYRITFGIESGNIETRKSFGKPFKLEQATRMIKYANKIGMWTICTFIFGFPNEDRNAIEDTIKYATTCGTDMAVFYLLCPHPGTEIYEEFKREGLLNYDHYFETPLNFSENFEKIKLWQGENTNCFTGKELNGIVAEAYRRFFIVRLKNSLNPLRTIRKIHSIEDFLYTFKLGKIAMKLMTRALLKKKTLSIELFWKKEK